MNILRMFFKKKFPMESIVVLETKELAEELKKEFDRGYKEGLKDGCWLIGTQIKNEHLEDAPVHAVPAHPLVKQRVEDAEFGFNNPGKSPPINHAPKRTEREKYGTNFQDSEGN